MYTQIIQKPANIGLITPQVDSNYLKLRRIYIKSAASDLIFNGKPAELEQTCCG